VIIKKASWYIVYIVFIFSSSSQLSPPCSTRVHCSQTKPKRIQREKENPPRKKQHKHSFIISIFIPSFNLHSLDLNLSGFHFFSSDPLPILHNFFFSFESRFCFCGCVFFCQKIQFFVVGKWKKNWFLSGLVLMRLFGLFIRAMMLTSTMFF
jgi:hypothetical protein